MVVQDKLSDYSTVYYKIGKWATPNARLGKLTLFDTFKNIEKYLWVEISINSILKSKKYKIFKIKYLEPKIKVDYIIGQLLDSPILKYTSYAVLPNGTILANKIKLIEGIK